MRVTHGQIWSVRLDPTVANEQRGTRPCVVVSIDRFNALPIRQAIVVPLTTRDRGFPHHITGQTGRVRIGVLGTVTVWAVGTRNGTEVGLRGLRIRGLLARLALEPDRPVTVEALIDALWGEAPPDAAGNALQALVSRLRRALGTDLVQTVPGGYRLLVAPDEVDASRFAALRATAAAQTDPAIGHPLLADALELWRGPALADVRELPFAGPAADALAEQRAAAVDERARLALRLGQPTLELDALRAQLTATPLRESTAALLARGLHAAGRRADALAVLDRTRSLLAEELGVDPGGELAAAQLAVLRGERPASQRPLPVTRSAGLTSFIGRAEDIRRVRELLSTARLVTLTGPGGAGKTRLAREALDGSSARSAELAALTGADQLAATLLSAIGSPELRLRAREEAPTATTERLLSALAGRDLLLLLDNCEHLIDAVAALVDRLLAESPRLRVLATSREPLGVPGEVLHSVEPLAADAAMRLFADRAAAVRPGFAPGPDEWSAIAEICRRLDHQPLPIELAAARLRTLSPAEITARLDDRFRLLTSGARTALPRHQTLRAVVDWSWDLLTEPERAVARRLAVFAGGATLAAAERVYAAAGAPATGEVLDLLAALVDKSLVVAVPGLAVPGLGAAPTRYRMLETIRHYAAERLDEAGERACAEAAHTAFVLELADTAEPHLRTREQLGWLSRLRAESDEITAVLRRSVAAGDAATAHRLVAAMTWSWLLRGLYDEPAAWVAAVCALPGDAPAEARARNLAFLAIIQVMRGEFAVAQQSLDAAVAMAAGLPTPRHPVLVLMEPVAALFTGGGDGPLRRAAAASADPWVQAIALQSRAQLAENEGDIEAQRELVRAAHAAFTPIGDRFGLGMAVHSLGELEELAGNREAARRAYDEAIALATELGNDDDLPQFLARRAQLDAHDGDLDGARAQLRRAAGIATGTLGNAGTVRAILAAVELRAGNLTEARIQLGLAVEDLAGGGMGVPQRRAFLAATRAEIERAAGDDRAARAALAEAVEAAIESRDGPVTATMAELAARFALDDGDASGAALLLGVASAQRGALNRGHPEVLATLDAVRDALGPAAVRNALERGRELPKPEGLALLRDYARRR